jgi:drug/metabolite transporter (DMT)-like permease
MSVGASKSGTRGHRAGIFDIRNIIGTLLGVDGVIILLVGIFGDAEEDKTGGVNANLWAGLVLVVMSAIFLTWAWLRPVVVPDDFEADHDDEGRPAGH